MAGILKQLLEQAEPETPDYTEGTPDDTVAAVDAVIKQNPDMAGVIRAVVDAIADEMGKQKGE